MAEILNEIRVKNRNMVKMFEKEKNSEGKL